MPARVVMETVGHSQISLTLNTYSHVTPALGRAAAEQIDVVPGTARWAVIRGRSVTRILWNSLVKVGVRRIVARDRFLRVDAGSIGGRRLVLESTSVGR